MNRKKEYKDMKRFASTKREQRRRWRKRTGCYEYPRRRWTDEEIELLLDQSITDRELSEMICRSVSAIYTKRVKVRKEISND